MNSLLQCIEYSIKNVIEDFLFLIVEKHPEIKTEDLQKIWNDVSNTSKPSVVCSIKHIKSKVSTSPVNKDVEEDKEFDNNHENKSIKKSSSTGGCPYEYIKGGVKGSICGSKIATGKTYCSRHKKYEGTVKEEKKAVPVPKSTQKNTIKPVKNKPVSPPVKAVSRVLYKHKVTGKLWHPETMLVFRSAKERIVIGKIIEDDKMIDLTNVDIDTCRKWGFAFSPKKDEEDEEEEEDDEEDTVINSNKYQSDRKIDEKLKDLSKKEKIHTKYFVAKSSSASGQKYWEVTVEGLNYSTRHGKVGKDGKIKTKTFSSTQEAIKEMEKNITSKIKKGYSQQPLNSSSKTVKAFIPEDDKSDRDSEESDDLENIIDELQGTSSDNSELEEDETKAIIVKNFIHNSLGIKGKTISKSQSKPLCDESDDDIEIEDLDEEDE